MKLLSPVDGTFIWTPSHDQRPCSLSTVLLRGCDPWRLGTAVQVERPKRNEDERPGRSAVNGTAWRRPPRSRDVAERRATAEPDPPICAPPALCWLAFYRSLCRPAAQRGPRHLAWPRVVGEGRLRCEPGPAVTGPEHRARCACTAVVYGPQVGRSLGLPCRPLETGPAMRIEGRPTRARGERAHSDRDQRTARRGE
jgi:hypothetical protein